MTNRLLPAEGAYDPVILLSWPHERSDWADVLDEVNRYYERLTDILVGIGLDVIIVTPQANNINAFRRRLTASDKVKIFECRTNDTWSRDFGPIVVNSNSEWIINDFKFNGWGLKFPACYDNLITSQLCSEGALLGKYENNLGFVLEGGSIESDGAGSIMTTWRCLGSPNRNGNLSRSEIENRLKETLGAKQILWLENGELAGDDTDAHIDTLARFCGDQKIIYTGCDDYNDVHFMSLERMKQELRNFRNVKGEPYELIELPLPDPLFDAEGLRMPATYANYLITPSHIIMPSYGQSEKDLLAATILKNAYNKEVIAIDSQILITQHGSLHCATMQMPKELINLKYEW